MKKILKKLLIYLLFINNCYLLNNYQNDDIDTNLLYLLLLHTNSLNNSYYLDTLELYNPNLNNFESLSEKMSNARVRHRSTILNDGKVLITGGSNNTDYALSSADVYDPNDRSITPISNMNERRSLHTQTLLSDGKVLITGGYCIKGESSLSSAELFDPLTQKFEVVGNMNFNRCSHGAVLLPNGKVLISGGTDPKTDIAVKESELYDPSTKIFSLSSDLINVRPNGIRMILSDLGEPFIFGGNNGNTNMNSIEIFNIVEEKFEVKNQLVSPRNVPDTVRLQNGNILIVSGRNNNQFLDSAELFNPSENLVKIIDSKVINATIDREPILLLNGKVLLAGGFRGSFRGALATSEIFDPVQNNFIQGPNMTIARHGHNATLLNDGNVLISGGRNIVR